MKSRILQSVLVLAIVIAAGVIPVASGSDKDSSASHAQVFSGAKPASTTSPDPAAPGAELTAAALDAPATSLPDSISAASATDEVALPTWSNTYDWSASGQGYVGWHASTNAADDYGIDEALGDNYGLWLWPLGGHKVYNSGDYAEWTYTAPGTTALESVSLSYEWSENLFAHHCVDVGLRAADGVVVSHNENCKPPKQHPLALTLTDPKPEPTAKVLFFRIHVDCGGAKTCSKTIPEKDPLKNGAFVRPLKVDMTLVDTDDPLVTPSGPFFDLAGTAIYGDRSYRLNADADEPGSGVTRVWVEQNETEIASIDSVCDPAHNTPELDNRICPKQQALTTSVDTAALAEGNYIYYEKARDVAGNVGTSGGWLVVIDRTPPSVAASGSLLDLGGTAVYGDRSYDLTVAADDSLSGVHRIWLEQNGVEIASVSSTCNPNHDPLPPDNRICPLENSLSTSIDTSKLAEGNYIYTVKADDAAGNVGVGQSWLVVVDRTPPSVTPSGSFYALGGTTTNTSQTYDLTVNASDSLSGVERIWVEQNGTEIASAGAVCNADHNPLPPDNRVCPLQKTLSTSIDTSNLSDGTYTYVVKARDAAGNVGQADSWTVVIDRTPPTISLSGSLYDARGATASEDNYELTANANDSGSGVGRIWLEENGEVIASVGDSCAPMGNIPPSGNPCPQQRALSATINTFDLDDGTYTFVVKSEDAVGNLRQSESWTVVIDLTAQYGDGSDDVPGGGADGYNPALDPDPACDAYSDLGIVDDCDSRASAGSISGEALQNTKPIPPEFPLTGLVQTASASHPSTGPMAVFWANRSAITLASTLAVHISSRSDYGDYYIAIEPGDTEKVPPVTSDPNATALSDAVCMANEKYDRANLPLNIHAAPVFNWTRWSDWRDQMFTIHGIRVSWKQMGIRFRKSMVAHGCREEDSWFVNELHSDWRHDKDYRRRFASLLQGLYYGDNGSEALPDVRGFLGDVVSSHSKNHDALVDYKSNLKTAYGDKSFWSGVDLYIKGWGKEIYTRCLQTCTADSKETLADKGVNPYSFHMRRLALATGNDTPHRPVRVTLGNRGMPLLNGIWNSKLPVYDTKWKEGMTQSRMRKLIRLQIFSVRRADKYRDFGSGRRIGFAWKEYDFRIPPQSHCPNVADQTTVNDEKTGKKIQVCNADWERENYTEDAAEAMVSALFTAYDDDNNPSAACGGSSANCEPARRKGTAFNAEWQKMFEDW